jgi:hypothetical protein
MTWTTEISDPPHTRRWAALSRLPWLLAVLSLAACANVAGPPVPEALTVQEPAEQLALNAEATDGCAFAGTWRYQAELPDGTVDGLVVVRTRGAELEAMHRFKAREKSVKPAGITCPYESCELCPSGQSCARRVYITAGVERGGRAAAGGAVDPAAGTRWTRLLLSEDGQALDISFWTPLRFLTARATKVQSAACDADFDYIREVARWANQSYPVPVLGSQ